jgi:hypothetical protein
LQQNKASAIRAAILDDDPAALAWESVELNAACITGVEDILEKVYEKTKSKGGHHG